MKLATILSNFFQSTISPDNFTCSCMFLIILPHAHFADRSIFIVQKNIATFFYHIIFSLLDNAHRNTMVHTINEGNLSLENVVSK